MTSEERRLHPRVQVRVRATCDVAGDRCTATLLDIAEGGAFILVETAHRDIGSNVMLRFWVVKTMCEAAGTTVRTVPTKAGPGLGVKFEKQNEAFATWIKALAVADDAERAHRLARVDKPVVFFH